MKWFKHFSDNHRGRSIQYLMDQLGHKGLTYYLLLEMCAEKLDKTKGEVVTETDCTFYFHPRVVQSSLRLSAAGVSSLLSAGAEVKLFSYEINSNEIKIMMPMLLDLLEKNLKKRTPRSLKESSKSPSDKDKDKDKDVEYIKINTIAASQISTEVEIMEPKKKALTSEQKDLNKRIWESYRDAYLLRWKQEPIRNATVNGQISMLRSRLGEDAVKVVSFYVMSNNSFYIGKCHPIGLCLNDAEGLRTQMLNGKAITTTMVRQFEKQNQMKESFEAIDEFYKDKK